MLLHPGYKWQGVFKNFLNKNNCWDLNSDLMVVRLALQPLHHQVHVNGCQGGVCRLLGVHKEVCYQVFELLTKFVFVCNKFINYFNIK